MSLGCSIQTTFRSGESELRVLARPANARVYVDDRFVATSRRLATRPHRLRPGVHYITIDAPGHFPHDVRLEMAEGLTTVNIQLRPIPP
jgi:hypothetical protein